MEEGILSTWTFFSGGLEIHSWQPSALEGRQLGVLMQITRVGDITKIHCLSISGSLCSPSGPIPPLCAIQNLPKQPWTYRNERERGVLFQPSLHICQLQLQPQPKPCDWWQKSGLCPWKKSRGQISLPGQAVSLCPLLPVNAFAEEHGDKAGEKQAQGHDPGHRQVSRLAPSAFFFN